MADQPFAVDLEYLGKDHPFFAPDRRTDWRALDSVVAPRAAAGSTVVAFESPFQAAIGAAILLDPDVLGQSALVDRVGDVLSAGTDHCGYEATPVAFTGQRLRRLEFGRRGIPPFGDVLLPELIDLLGDRRARAAIDALGRDGVWDFLTDAELREYVSLVWEPPIEREDGRQDEPLVWPDGWTLHLERGIPIERAFFHDPGSIRAADVFGARSLERRRVLFDIADLPSLLGDLNATVLDEASAGRLWTMDDPTGQDEAAVFVEVEDATPLSDGTRKRYWLRVPPDQTSAVEAVAWTFALDADRYRPTIET